MPLSQEGCLPAVRSRSRWHRRHSRTHPRRSIACRPQIDFRAGSDGAGGVNPKSGNLPADPGLSSPQKSGPGNQAGSPGGRGLDGTRTGQAGGSGGGGQTVYSGIQDANGQPVVTPPGGRAVSGNGGRGGTVRSEGEVATAVKVGTRTPSDSLVARRHGEVTAGTVGTGAPARMEATAVRADSLLRRRSFRLPSKDDMGTEERGPRRRRRSRRGGRRRTSRRSGWRRQTGRFIRRSRRCRRQGRQRWQRR